MLNRDFDLEEDNKFRKSLSCFGSDAFRDTLEVGSFFFVRSMYLSEIQKKKDYESDSTTRRLLSSL